VKWQCRVRRFAGVGPRGWHPLSVWRFKSFAPETEGGNWPKLAVLMPNRPGCNVCFFHRADAGLSHTGEPTWGSTNVLRSTALLRI